MTTLNLGTFSSPQQEAFHAHLPPGPDNHAHFLSVQNRLLWTFRTNGNICRGPFVPGFSVLSHVSELRGSVWVRSLPVWRTPRFVYPSIGWWPLDCVYVCLFAIMGDAAVNIWVHVCFTSWCISRNGIAGSHGNCMFNLFFEGLIYF